MNQSACERIGCSDLFGVMRLSEDGSATSMNRVFRSLVGIDASMARMTRCEMEEVVSCVTTRMERMKANEGQRNESAEVMCGQLADWT